MLFHLVFLIFIHLVHENAFLSSINISFSIIIQSFYHFIIKFVVVPNIYYYKIIVYITGPDFSSIFPNSLSVNALKLLINF